MARWEPNARGRLEQAALELFHEHGYDAVTVAQIASRAGLAERTFFRHYADKREVLFGGAGDLQDFLIGRLNDAPDGLAPMATVGHALAGLDAVFADRREFARTRQAVIAANADLRERELVKLARLADAVADALRRRGVADPSAGLAAELGIAVFKIGFERWTASSGRRHLSAFIKEALVELDQLTSAATG